MLPAAGTMVGRYQSAGVVAPLQGRQAPVFGPAQARCPTGSWNPASDPWDLPLDGVPGSGPLGQACAGAFFFAFAAGFAAGTEAGSSVSSGGKLHSTEIPSGSG